MKKRNQVVDMIKLFAAFFVVFLHFPFEGRFGDAIFAAARFAVPFFFMVSGYFYAKPDKTAQYKSTKSKVRHIAALLCAAEGLSIVWKIIRLYNTQVSFAENVVGVFTGAVSGYQGWRAISFTPLFNYGAWFMVQLIVVYCMYALLTKYSALRAGKYLAMGGFVFGYAAIRICALLQIELPPYLDYFILFMGFPFFSLGYWLKESAFAPKKMKNLWLCGALLLLGTVLSYCEILVFPSGHVYLGSLLILLVLVSLFTNYADYEAKTVFGKLFGYLGNRISLYIYLLQSVVGLIVTKVFGIIPFRHYIAFLLPIVVCIATAAVSVVVFQINRAIKNWRTKKGL